MTHLSIFEVTKIELASTYVENGNSRTIRITSRPFGGDEQTLDLVVYGNTVALDVLPKSSDFFEAVEAREPDNAA